MVGESESVSGLGFSEAELIASICRESYYDFVLNFWPAIPGAGKFIPSWHIQYLCDEIQYVAERVFQGLPVEHDLICNIAPGTSKSTVFSILFLPWTWTRMPGARHLTGTHTESLALDLSYRSKAVVQSDLYQACFPDIKIRKDSNENFTNNHGGERITCTVGGKSPMGRHSHFLTLDDPLDPQRAMSVAEVKVAENFVNNIFPTRKADKQVSVTMLVMQRVGTGDPTEVMLNSAKKEGATPVKLICLPAEVTDDIHPPDLVKHYIDGLMDPVRLSKAVLDNFRTKGEYWYASQFLQRPIPLGGGMFKEEFFLNRCLAAPYEIQRIRFWDRAASDDPDSCNTAGVLMGRGPDGRCYIEHVELGHWEPYRRNEIMRAVALRDRLKYGPKYEPVIYVEREGGASGRDAWKGVARALAGFVVREQQVTGKKDTRAEPWACQLAAGNVWVVEDSSWDLQGYIQEHLLFRPMVGGRLGKRKDQVDASSGAFNLLYGPKATGTVYILGGGPKKPKAETMILVCSKDSLNNSLMDKRTILVSLFDPPKEGSLNTETAIVPIPNMSNCLASMSLCFADIDPADYQETWGDPVEPYGRKPEDLIITREMGKRLWAFLLKKRDPPAELFVLQDDQDDEERAISIAYGVCDILRIPRSSVYLASSPDDNKSGVDGDPPNRHVYQTVRATRGMVVS